MSKITDIKIKVFECLGHVNRMDSNVIDIDNISYYKNVKEDSIRWIDDLKRTGISNRKKKKIGTGGFGNLY